jgi:hypothetical protein
MQLVFTTKNNFKNRVGLSLKVEASQGIHPDNLKNWDETFM